MEILQPYIDNIVMALVGLFVMFILGVIAMLRVKVNAWLVARTTVTQREILHRLAGEASALAESAYISGDGPEKLDAAMVYVIERINKLGINISHQSIQAAVEKSVQDYNAKVKGGGELVVTSTGPVNISKEA